jgi:hypothetical protein
MSCLRRCTWICKSKDYYRCLEKLDVYDNVCTLSCQILLGASLQLRNNALPFVAAVIETRYFIFYIGIYDKIEIITASRLEARYLTLVRLRSCMQF